MSTAIRCILLSCLVLWCGAAGAQEIEGPQLLRLPPTAPAAIPTPQAAASTASGASAEAAPVSATEQAAAEDAAESGEENLVAEEVAAPEEERVYSWYDVRQWMPREGFEASAEMGLNGTAGNTETLSERIGSNIKWTRGQNTWDFNGIYNMSSENGQQTANNALGQARFEHAIGDSRWSLYSLSLIEYDEFRTFDVRLATNLGFGYLIIKNDRTKLNFRLGSGVSKELDGPDQDPVPEADIGVDFEHQLTRRQKINCITDYYPDWTNWATSYRIITTAGWEFLIDEEMHLSLKAAILNRYDSTGDGARPNDLNYSLLLMWKT
ncbi:MAG: DUF481 domain-containing protein [Pirellulales bacterium]|nr:DUF481 domain-containing protein [Pirellulales bacterium]